MEHAAEVCEHETTVAIGLVRRDDAFLVGHRAPGTPLAGRAEFPGGKCLPGEPPEAAVVRECREETGLTVAVLRRRRDVRHAYPHGRLHLVFLDCAAAEGPEPLPPFRWVARSDLAHLRFPEANRVVIAELLREVDGTEVPG